MLSETPLLPWLDRLREEVPGVDLFDAHTHIGRNDPDGFRCEPEELLAGLEQVGSRAAVFPMHEPDGYPGPNDRVIDVARNSGGKLVAFCRLDPEVDPAAEAARCLDAGARGIKLHPRAEQFTLDHPALVDVFELAAERGAPVLVHAGRGIPALGRHAVDACRSHPGLRLILAHAGICDLAWIWQDAAELPGLYFDTAWWSPADLQALFALVPPGQILMASDAPYGTLAFGALSALRYGLQAGLDHDQLRGVLGGQFERLVSDQEPLDLGGPVGAGGIPLDPLLERVHTFLTSAFGQMSQGLEARETLALAQLACEVGEDSPRGPLYRAVLTLIQLSLSFVPAPEEERPRFTPGAHLIIFALLLTRTPDVPLPDFGDEGADLSERERGAEFGADPAG